MRFASAVGLLCIGLAHYDATPTVSYVLQDDNYNVVALANTSGQVIRQHALDPYGNLIARDDFPGFGQTSVPKTRLGHQGLMVDRLDAPWDVDLAVTSGGSTATPDATPRLIYLNRNRIYDPLFARFNQRDPNATGLGLLTAAIMGGRELSISLQTPDIESSYADGINLYGYLGSNPANQQDPTGLDWWDEIDQIIGEYAVSLFHVSMQLDDAKGNLAKGARDAALYAAAAFLWDDFIWDRDEAILLEMVTGIFFSSACFDGATLVTLSDGSMEPISSIETGMRVLSAPAGTSHEQTTLSGYYVGEWNRISIELRGHWNEQATIELLRPASWAIAMQIEQGNPVWLSLPEVGVEGRASAHK